MIKALMLYSCLEVTISGETIAEFSESLGKLQRLISPCDRDWQPDRKTWIVKNVAEYKDISWVRKALEERNRQLTLY
jgi:hypothetical protein